MKKEEFDARKVELKKYENQYSESDLWDKIKKVAGKAGRVVVYNALLLYYALKSDKVTAKEKAIIVGALGYFILPLDIIPDIIPVLGYTDDAALLVFAINQLNCVDDSVKAQAEAKLNEWF